MKRQYYWSHEIKKDQEVDMLWPMGTLVPRAWAQEVFGRADLWQRMRQECANTTRGDDFIAFVAAAIMGKESAVVVRTKKRAVLEHFSEGKTYALSKQPTYKLKRRTMPIWRALGYAPLDCREPHVVSKETFGERWKTAEESLKAIVKQSPEECEQVFWEIAKKQPASFLEIGSHWGGSLYVYAGACKPGARIVAIDDGKRYPARKILKRVIAQLRNEGYDAVCVRGNSHQAETRNLALSAIVPNGAEAAKVILEGPTFEFIHVDGDHSEAGVRQDWKDYWPVLAECGIIAFHDIVATSKGCKVGIVWPEIKEHAIAKGKEVREIVGEPPAWRKEGPVGVGLIWK